MSTYDNLLDELDKVKINIIELARKAPLEELDVRRNMIYCVWCRQERIAIWINPGEPDITTDHSYHNSNCAGLMMKKNFERLIELNDKIFRQSDE